jgi:hypothetical protein
VAVLAVVGIGLALLKHHSLLHRGTLATGASSTAASTPAVVSAPASPPTVVERYYAAISRRAYLRAWKLGGDRTGPTYPQFIAGYRGTQRDVVTILTWTGDQVTAKVAALQTDGTVKQYKGAYVVQNGVITSFNVVPVG